MSFCDFEEIIPKSDSEIEVIKVNRYTIRFCKSAVNSNQQYDNFDDNFEKGLNFESDDVFR